MNTELGDLDTLKKLPKTEPPRTTLLDILDVATKEIYITQAYAYFLDHRSGFDYQEEFARCFFNEILGSEGENWINCEVRSEQTVIVKGEMLRIDLLFLTECEALIVENKIYAGKYNDLAGYEQGVKEKFNKCRIKKLFLSFDPTGPENVAHQSICGKMKIYLDSVHLDQRSYQYYQVLEFVVHMIQLKKNFGNMTDLTNYIDHAEAIANAESIKRNAWNYFDSLICQIGENCIREEIEKNTVTIDESYFNRSRYRWLHIRPSKVDKTVYLTIAFEEFLKEGKAKPIYLIVESTDINFTELEDHFNNSKSLLGLKKATRTEKYWRHYFIKEVYWIDPNDSREILERLSGASIELFREILIFNQRLGGANVK